MKSYEEYHVKVVEACVAYMGEQSREFFDKTCEYHEEWERGDTPDQVAEAQRESL